MTAHPAVDTDSPGAAALARFRAVLLAELGLVYPDSQTAMLAELLARRAAEHRMAPQAYLLALEAGRLHAELDLLAPSVTTAETYFYRNIEQFHVLRERVLPEGLARSRAEGRGLSILSAGCASGEELHTVAIVLQEADPHAPAGLHDLLGVDLNPQVLRKARAGLYTAWSLRETPPAARDRWFVPEGSSFRLRADLRERVRFEQRNLSLEDPGFWRDGRFDVIFARNVLMYFSRQALHAAVARLARALAPGGYLFLGHSESLRELVRDFEVCHTHGTFYYRRRASPAPEPEDWMSAIERATQRVRGLTAPPTRTAMTSTAAAAAATVRPPAAARPSPVVAGTTPAAGADGSQAFAAALALFVQERFGEAEALLDALPADQAGQAESGLLRAMLHVHAGDLQRAEDTAHAVLTRTPRCAEAHYVIGLCRESGGDRPAAANRYTLAARLDPQFALPHVHLAQLARRRGDRRHQRLSQDKAAALLEHERAQRIALFGGGFDRQALLAMCRDTGGTP